MRPALRARADEAETGSGWGAPSAASSTAAAGAAGGAAAGASAWAARGDDESDPESERIASAADFRDDVSGDPAEEREEAVDEAPAPGQEHDGVYAADDAGTEPDMSDDSRTETAEHASHDDGLEAGGGAAAASAGAGGAYAATRALHEETANEQADRADADAADGTADRADAADGTADRADGDARPTADGTADRADGDADAADGTADRTDSASTDTHATHDSDTSQEPADDLSHDVESPRGEWGGPRKDEPAEMTVISEPEAYATTEPVMASDQTPPVTPDRDDTDREAGDREASDREASDRDREAGDREAGDREATDRAPAEAGAAVVETDDTDRSAADVAEESNEERYDPTPTRDWAADEGELLEETHDRGDRLEAERADLAHQSDDAAASHDATASDDATDATASDDATDAAASDDASRRDGSPGSADLRLRRAARRRLRGRLGRAPGRRRPAARPPGAGLPRHDDLPPAGRRRLRLGRAARLVLRRGRRRAQRVPALRGLIRRRSVSPRGHCGHTCAPRRGRPDRFEPPLQAERNRRAHRSAQRDPTG